MPVLYAHAHTHTHTHTHTHVIHTHTHCRYGDQFLQEAYLYHITRRDIKHNFSVYFYLLYLIQGSWLSLPVGLLAFLPQASLLAVTALWLHGDIVFCCFIQTFVFVSFNKVCTSQVCVCVCVCVCVLVYVRYVCRRCVLQYFLWYLCLLPLILPFSKLKLREWALIASLWFAGQVHLQHTTHTHPPSLLTSPPPQSSPSLPPLSPGPLVGAGVPPGVPWLQHLPPHVGGWTTVLHCQCVHTC